MRIMAKKSTAQKAVSYLQPIDSYAHQNARERADICPVDKTKNRNIVNDDLSSAEKLSSERQPKLHGGDKEPFSNRHEPKSTSLLLLGIEACGDSLGKGNTMSHPLSNDREEQLYPDNEFFAQVSQDIDSYLETVTVEQYFHDLCEATYPRKPVFYDELVEKISGKNNTETK